MQDHHQGGYTVSRARICGTLFLMLFPRYYDLQNDEGLGKHSFFQFATAYSMLTFSRRRRVHGDSTTVLRSCGWVPGYVCFHRLRKWDLSSPKRQIDIRSLRETSAKVRVASTSRASCTDTTRLLCSLAEFASHLRCVTLFLHTH